ncbi:MAG TPA: hypothetical protein VEI97_03375, partial [bacterium]|nr:hypothetical protein [bacterium]
MPMTWVRAAAALPLLLLVGGMGLACGTPPGAEGGRGLEATTLAELPEGEIPPQPPSRYLGKFIYQNHCGVCHGQIGPTLAVPGTPPPPKEVTLEPAEEQDPGTTGDNAPAKTDLGTAESPV